MVATWIVLVLATILLVVISNSPFLSDRTRWFLLLLGLFAGTLAALRWLGTI
jgi:hypothetical protein